MVSPRVPRTSPAPHRGHPSPSLLPRLARIEGQVRGIARMIEEERWCPDVLTQLSAVEAALSRVREELLSRHLDRCVSRILESGSADEKRSAVLEVVESLRRAR